MTEILQYHLRLLPLELVAVGRTSISLFTMADFLQFKSAFKGDIVEPSSPDYPAAIARWAAQTSRKARYVAFPKTTEDVALAIKFATSNKLTLAIKCGGHNPSGASSAEDGLVIDLVRYFNTARVDPEKKLAYVGGGALWETVDVAAAAHGLATPAGTVNHTGVAGLALGGGYGWLTGEHGLVVDNIAQATVVTASGSVLTASETSHPDLFWGIRGGGSNFGVVTEFVLKLHPQRKTVFAGLVIFAPAHLSKIAHIIDNWYPSAGEKEGLVLILTRGPPPERMPAAVLVVFYNGSEAEGRAKYKEIYDLGPLIDNSREIPYEKVNGLLNENAKHGRNYYMGGTSLRSEAVPQMQKVFDHMVELTAKHPDPESSLDPFKISIAYEFFPTPKINTVASDAMAFRSRGPQPNIATLVVWDKDEPGEDSTPYARRCVRELNALIESTETRQPKEDENEVYGNYVCEPSDMLPRMQRLWGDNYPRLQKIKKQYDPDVVFNRWFPIQPAA